MDHPPFFSIISLGFSQLARPRPPSKMPRHFTVPRARRVLQYVPRDAARNLRMDWENPTGAPLIIGVPVQKWLPSGYVKIAIENEHL